MSHQTGKGQGRELASALGAAAADLLDVDDVRVDVTIPDGVEVDDVTVRLEADVTRPDGEAPTSTEADVAELAPALADDERDDDPDDDPDDERDDERDGEPDDQLDREADAAADFVEGILDSMDLVGELQIRLNDAEQSVEVEVVDMDTGVLIGRRGSTLEAVQELMRCALQSQFERRVRVTVDVEGYRARRLEKLLDKADEVIDEVLDTGEPIRLEPMDVFERKAVHELVGTVDGVTSSSHGREPSRRVVIEPDAD